VKSLVGMHGGEMQVQSRIDEGTTVTITLPLEFTPQAERASNVATLNPAARTAPIDQAHQVKKSA
jgi:cell cycle sensor histidine kinase DivJ